MYSLIRARYTYSDEPTTVVEEPAFAAKDIESALTNLEKETLHESWYNVLESEFQKPYFKKASNAAMDPLDISLKLL